MPQSSGFSTQGAETIYWSSAYKKSDPGTPVCYPFRMIRVSFLAVITLSVVFQAHGAKKYLSREFSILSDAGGNVGICDLGAILQYPERSHAKGLILLVHGSGTANRDAQLPDRRAPFKDIASALTNSDLATLRFDKRGIQPECRAPLVDNQQLSPFHFIQDVRNILKFIQHDSELRDLPIILLGYSEGVNFVAEIATETAYANRIKGLVLLAGLGRYAIDETLLRQFQQQIENPDLTEEAKAQLRELLNQGEDFFRKIRQDKVDIADKFLNMYTKYWKDWIELTERSSQTAALLKVPSLVLQGDADKNVTSDDFEALKIATQAHQLSDASLFPELDHFFSTKTSTQVSKDVTDSISQWAGRLLR